MEQIHGWIDNVGVENPEDIAIGTMMHSGFFNAFLYAIIERNTNIGLHLGVPSLDTIASGQFVLDDILVKTFRMHGDEVRERVSNIVQYYANIVNEADIFAQFSRPKYATLEGWNLVGQGQYLQDILEANTPIKATMEGLLTPEAFEIIFTTGVRHWPDLMRSDVWAGLGIIYNSFAYKIVPMNRNDNTTNFAVSIEHKSKTFYDDSAASFLGGPNSYFESQDAADGDPIAPGNAGLASTYAAMQGAMGEGGNWEETEPFWSAYTEFTSRSSFRDDEQAVVVSSQSAVGSCTRASIAYNFSRDIEGLAIESDFKPSYEIEQNLHQENTREGDISQDTLTNLTAFNSNYPQKTSEDDIAIIAVDVVLEMDGTGRTRCTPTFLETITTDSSGREITAPALRESEGLNDNGGGISIVFAGLKQSDQGGASIANGNLPDSLYYVPES